MEKQGKVIAVEKGKANVLIYRESACEGCHKRCDGSCGESKPIEAWVDNEMAAKVGDSVTLYTPDKEIATSAVLIYLLPIIFAIIAATLVSEFANTVAVAVTFFAVIAVCFAVAALVSSSMKKMGILQIRMIEVYREAENETEKKN